MKNRIPRVSGSHVPAGEERQPPPLDPPLAFRPNYKGGRRLRKSATFRSRHRIMVAELKKQPLCQSGCRMQKAAIFPARRGRLQFAVGGHRSGMVADPHSQPPVFVSSGRFSRKATTLSKWSPKQENNHLQQGENGLFISCATTLSKVVA